jgi:hypothetical protein
MPGPCSRAIAVGARVLVAMVIVSAVSCKDNTVEPLSPRNTSISFSLIYASTRWCTMQWTNSQKAASHYYIVVRNGQDTVYRDSVKPEVPLVAFRDSTMKASSTFLYRIYRIVEGGRRDSADLTVQTLDTTKSQYAWEKIRLGNPGSVLNGVWGTSPQSVWMCGFVDSGARSSNILHFVDGVPRTWNIAAATTRWSGCYGVSDSSVYFVGVGAMTHFNGVTFKTDTLYGSGAPVHSGELVSVWVTPDDKEVFAVGIGGSIVHRNANKVWEKQTSGTVLALTSVWGFSATDVYAAGQGPTTGILLHYNGSTWQDVVKGDPAPPDSTFLYGRFAAISGASPDSMVIAGDSIYHRYQGAWQKRTPDTHWQLTYFRSVDAHLWNNIFAVGEFGEIIKHDGDHWVAYQQYLDYSSDLNFNQVVLLGGEPYIVGGDGESAVLVHGR